MTFFRAEYLDADIAALYADLGLTPADYRAIIDEAYPCGLSAEKAAVKTRQKKRLAQKAKTSRRDPFALWLAQAHPDLITTAQAALMLKTTANNVAMMVRNGNLRGRTITPADWSGIKQGRNRIAVMREDVVKAQTKRAKQLTIEVTT